MMTSDPLPDGADRLDELLADWVQACAERGRDLAPEEVCRDCPELAPALARRLQAVRQVEALVTPGGETTDWSPADQPAEPGPPPGLPGYEVLGRTGWGGMGVVYKVRNLSLKRVEAIKVIRAGGFAGPRDLARFRFEAEAAAGLDHPNIVTVYGVGEAGGRPYLAMRWVDGTSLAEWQPGSAGEVARLMGKAARGVDYAHRRGILHRDLKPANILVDASGEPHVADFGIARRLGGEATVTQVGGVVGTPAYMSPEQARGVTDLTVASDVYALGAVLYELLADRPPYTGSVPAVLAQVQSDEAPPEPRRLNPAADPDLEAVCLKCLEKDAPRRYRTAGELADDLDRYVRGEPVSARPPGFWDWLRQVWKTRPEPSPHYAWQMLLWTGVVCLLMHGAVFAFAAGGGSAAGVWAVNLGGWVAILAFLWYYLARRFRHLKVAERYAMMTAVGHCLGHLGLFLALVPLSAAVPAADTLGLYPPLAALGGLTLFVNGATYWSRFLPIGLGLMVAAPVVMAEWPAAAPLVYGVVYAGVLWYWSYLKKVKFGGRG
jgi:serine/threonine-protein kinase